MKNCLVYLLFNTITLSIYAQKQYYPFYKVDSVVHISFSNNVDKLEPLEFNAKIHQYELTKLKLDFKQSNNLTDLINDSSNFNNSECGTPFYEGAFIFYKNGQNNAIIYYACDNTQFYFDPKNVNSKYGTLNIKGQNLFKKILN